MILHIWFMVYEFCHKKQDLSSLLRGVFLSPMNLFFNSNDIFIFSFLFTFLFFIYFFTFKIKCFLRYKIRSVILSFQATLSTSFVGSLWPFLNANSLRLANKHIYLFLGELYENFLSSLLGD